MRPDADRLLTPRLVAPLVALLAAAPALAAGPPPPPERLWSVEVVVGASAGGPEDDLVAVMRSSGWGDTSPGFFGAGTTYPLTEGSTGVAWGTFWAVARRRLGAGRFSVGLGGGWSELGTVSGYRRLPGYSLPYGYTLEAKSSVATVAALAWYDVFPSLRVGVGPALHAGRVAFSGAFGPPAGSSGSKLGLVADTTLSVPVDTPFHLTATLPYRWVGSVRLDGWAATDSRGTVLSFPASDVDVSHGVAALGLGFRL